MIIRKLPHPDPFFPVGKSPNYPDHTLFTATLAAPCRQPEFTAGPGIFTLLSGSAQCIHNNRKETLQKGQFLLFNQDSRVSISISHSAIHPLDAQPLFLFFHTGLLRETLRQQDADLAWIQRVHPLPVQVLHCLEWISRLGNSCASFSALKADSLIRRLMEDLVGKARTADRLSKKLPVSKRSTRIDLFKRLSQTREWIEANYSAPITLDDMAGAALLNSQHFLRMFRDCYGITPHRFLTNTRLQAARQLLHNSTDTVSSICRQTGFESLSSFSGLFRQHYGLTPSALRSAASPRPQSSATPGPLPAHGASSTFTQ